MSSKRRADSDKVADSGFDHLPRRNSQTSQMNRQPRCHRKIRGGYTLVEVVVASASSMLLLAGMGSSIFIASKAFDEGDSDATKSIAAGNVADEIMGEMQYATRFSERTPYAVTFNIPDRDGDGSEEKLRYAWSGVAGDPLTKELNGSAASVLLGEVTSLNFTYMTRAVIAPPPPVLVVPEVVFEEFTDAKESSDNDRVDISRPAGTSEGDLLIAAVATDGNTKSQIAPEESGWTLIAVEERYSAVTLGVWWKIAGSTEPIDYRFRWQDGPDEQAYGWIMRFTGHDPITPITDSTILTTGSGDTTTPPSPAVTTSVSNSLVLRIGGFDDDDIVFGDPGLPGHTAINMDDTGSGNSTCSGGAGYVSQANAGASGESTFALAAEEQTVAITIAIAPAP